MNASTWLFALKKKNSKSKHKLYCIQANSVVIAVNTFSYYGYANLLNENNDSEHDHKHN